MWPCPTLGEWAPATSDIDLVAVLDGPVDQVREAALHRLFDQLEAEAGQLPKWLYIYHMGESALAHPQFVAPGGPRGFRYGNQKRTDFSGFPMSICDAYQIRRHGRTLWGKELISRFPEATETDVVAMTRRYLRATVEQWGDRAPFQPGPEPKEGALFHFTEWTARALWTLEHGGEVTTKGRGIAWAQDRLGPRFAAPLDVARALRFEPDRVTPAELAILREAFPAYFWAAACLMLEALGLAAPEGDGPPVREDGRLDYTGLLRALEG